MEWLMHTNRPTTVAGAKREYRKYFPFTPARAGYKRLYRRLRIDAYRGLAGRSSRPGAREL